MIWLAVIGLIVLLILAHEFGHFLSAKLSGVKVEEFGLGYPPRLLGVRWRETLYSLNLLPFGGFVRLSGEEDPQAPGGLASKSINTRLFVLGSAALVNALLPFLLLTASFMIPKEVATGEILIREVAPGSPAELAGLRPGDRILEVNGRSLLNTGDLLYSTQLNLGSPTTLLIQRGDAPPQPVKLTPRWSPPAGQGPMGIMMGMENVSLVRVSYPLWQAFPQGVRFLADIFKIARNEIRGSFIRGTAPQVGGPIAIVQIAGEVARSGSGPLLAFTAFLSMNLAILNLLPLPGLDGGRLTFVVLEWVRRGKRVSPQREGLVHLIGFALLVALLILVSYYDILRLISGESLIP